MSNLDFCKLEVTVIHSLQSFTTAEEKFKNVSEIIKYFDTVNGLSASQIVTTMTTGYPSNYSRGNLESLKSNVRDSTTNSEKNKLTNTEDNVIKLIFDNTMLNCELKIVDSVDDNSDCFVFRVWRFPENTVLSVGDYLLFKYYWESDPTKYTTYHGVIKEIGYSRTNADQYIAVKGQLVNQNILYNWSIYEKYPKLTYYSEIRDFIENELKFQFVSMITGFNEKINLPEPILTRTKPVGVILENICEQMNKYVLKEKNDTCGWKFVNGHTILLYKNSDLGGRILNEHFKISVPSILYNDLLEYTNNGDGTYIMQLFGLPTLVSGIVFYIDTSFVPDYIKVPSDYYIVEEIEHRITVWDGYEAKIYCRLAE